MQIKFLKTFKDVRTYQAIRDLNIHVYKSRLSIILYKNIGFIWPRNAVFNVFVALNVFTRGTRDGGSNDVNLFLMAALVVCMILFFSCNKIFHKWRESLVRG